MGKDGKKVDDIIVKAVIAGIMRFDELRYQLSSLSLGVNTVVSNHLCKQNIHTECDGVEKLLDILWRRPVKYWEMFLQCLKDCGHTDLAAYLSEDDDERPEPPTAEDCVRPHSVTIIKRLDATPQVSRALHKENILDDEDIEHIKNANSREEVNEIIITTLCRQPKPAWQSFIKILVESKHENLAFEIDEEVASMIPVPEGKDDRLEQSESDSESIDQELAEIERKRIVLKEKKKRNEEKKKLRYWGEKIKKNVCSRGHVANRYLDRAINLDEQFITLRLVGSNSHWEMDVVNNSLPDRYLDRLQKLDRSDIQMTDIMKLVKKESSFLIYGRAGIGKSTLIQKLTRLWAQKKWAQKYEAVFLFNIRNLTVLDRRSMSLIEFLNMAIYVSHDDPSTITVHSLLEEMERVMFFFDGIDEFADFENAIGNIKCLKEEELAEPIEWCVNFLRRNIMKKSIMILASRPFPGLVLLECDPVIEVVGLTQDRILDFIEHHVKPLHKDRVRRSMTSNPLVMSVSTITYFCALFCQVLEEDQDVPMGELQTYTRIASFFIKKYLSRCPAVPSLPHVRPSSILPPLARLAYRGLIENRVSEDLARLVFDETDHDAVNLTEDDVNSSGECGILLSLSSVDPEKEEETISSEFVHLTVQEMLAMLELHLKDEYTTRQAARMMWSSSRFNMAKMYLFGIKYDTDSLQINEIKQSMSKKRKFGRSKKSPERNENEDLIMELTTKDTSRSKDLLQTVQVAYETQNKELVKSIATSLFIDSDEMTLGETLLTAIDMNGIIFMLQQANNIVKLRLEQVTMDEVCSDLLSTYLRTENTLQDLSLDGSKLSGTSVGHILQGFGTQSHQKTLSLSQSCMDSASVSALVNGINGNSFITSLSLAGCKVGDLTVLVKLMQVLQMVHLEALDLSDTGLCEDGIQVVSDALASIDLHQFSFAGNKLKKKEKLDHLLHVLQKKRLAKLDLSKTSLTREGVGAVLCALNNMELTELKLNNISLGPTAVLELLKGANQKLAHLELRRAVPTESILDVAAALSTNVYLQSLDLRWKEVPEETVDGVMRELMSNQTLQILKFGGGSHGITTLVAVPNTGRRVRFYAEGSDIFISAWKPHDILASSVLRRTDIEWRGIRLGLNFHHDLIDKYGEKPEDVVPGVFLSIIHDITHSPHRVEELSFRLSHSDPIYPILTSVTECWHQILRKEIKKVECSHGEIKAEDLNTWYTNLIGPDWSVNAVINRYLTDDGAEITNNLGQSLTMKLSETVVTTQSEIPPHLQVSGLLFQPRWS